MPIPSDIERRQLQQFHAMDSEEVILLPESTLVQFSPIPRPQTDLLAMGCKVHTTTHEFYKNMIIAS